MATIKETIVSVVAGVPGMTLRHEAKMEERDGRKVFVADLHVIEAGGHQVAKVVDGGAWPVVIEQQHADPTHVTVHKAQTPMMLRAMLAAVLGDDHAAAISARAPLSA